MLNQLLQAYKGLMIDSTDPALIKQVMAEIEQRRTAPGFSEVLGSGASAPNPNLHLESEGAGKSLGDLLADGPVLLKFYRGSWCPFCTLELKAYERIAPQLKRLGVRLIGISSESPERIKLTRQFDCPSFEIVHDANNDIARAFGLTYEAGPAERALFEHHGATEHLGDPANPLTMAMPAVYLIEPDGRVSYASVSPDPTTRAEPGDLVERIRAARNTEIAAHT
ncbi:MAG: peroxiredoxin-like family protein [Burkholderiaceae bacterium]